MAAFTACVGTGRPAVNVARYPAIPSAGVLDPGSPASTFGECPVCGRTVKGAGPLKRHKDQRDMPAR